MDKICILTNGQFSWTLEVDGHIINFDGGYNAAYFEQHYSALGYSILIKHRYNNNNKDFTSLQDMHNWIRGRNNYASM